MNENGSFNKDVKVFKMVNDGFATLETRARRDGCGRGPQVEYYRRDGETSAGIQMDREAWRNRDIGLHITLLLVTDFHVNTSTSTYEL